MIRSSTTSRRATVGAALAASVLAIVGCSDSSGATSATTVVPTVAPSTTVEPDDGVLRLGALLPLSGPGAEIGQSMADAVELAVDQVNAAGGVGGGFVELVVADEGDGPTSAARAIEELLAADVDAVIGPGSSVVALDVLVTLRRERLVTCSPGATSLALDDFPDDGLFFRTVPSDSVQAGAIARAIDLTGRSSVAILYIDDAYGRPLTNSVTAQLAGRAVTVRELVPYRADQADFSAEVDDALSSGAQVFAVIGDAESGPRVVAALLEESQDQAIPIVVNDAMRGSATGNVLRRLPDATAERVRGVGLQVLTDNADFAATFAERYPASSGFLAVNAFECVDLIALASSAARSTSSTEIASRMTSVAGGGQRCVTFSDCELALAEERNIDYEGPSGTLQLSSAGELTGGTYDLFGFDPLGRERPLGELTVGADQSGAVP